MGNLCFTQKFYFAAMVYLNGSSMYLVFLIMCINTPFRWSKTLNENDSAKTVS